MALPNKPSSPGRMRARIKLRIASSFLTPEVRLEASSYATESISPDAPSGRWFFGGQKR
jgi:hypothetical protein